MIEDIIYSGMIVGYYTFRNGGKLFIDDIQIEPEFQGKGICTQFLLDLLETHDKIVLKNIKNHKVFERIIEKITSTNGYAASVNPLNKEIVVFHSNS
ncbi:MAG: hypothetical protein ACFFCD_11625 [Promethearchaeota archaeon]